MSYDPKKIDLMLVDDDGDFRETVARRFMRRGFRVQEAAHGEQALQLADLREFDVVVLDMVMPGMSGIELFRVLAARSPGLEEKLVFMTGGAFTPEAEAFLDEIKNPRVEKPFDFASVDQLLRMAAARGTSR